MKELINLLNEDISFDYALNYFKEKVPMTSSEFYKLSQKYRGFAFTVSGYSSAQILKKFYDELLKALEDGTTMKQFKDNMNIFLEDKGYEGLSNFQADNIFRTNIQTAYNVGHYTQMTQPEVMNLRPYWQYDAVNDKRTRPSHLVMDGKVFRADDPIWDTWYPPNGYRCRCVVKTLSKRQVEKRGLKIEDKAPIAGVIDGKFIPVVPDYRFRTNPAKQQFEPNMKDYPESIKKAFEKRNKSKK